MGAGVIAREDIRTALEEQASGGGSPRLGEILVRRRRIGLSILAWALACQQGDEAPPELLRIC